MRPVRPGIYESDLAGLQRLRRRVGLDEDQTVDWRRDMQKRIDEVIRRVNAAVSKRMEKPASKRPKKTIKEAARVSS